MANKHNGHIYVLKVAKVRIGQDRRVFPRNSREKVES